MKMVPLPVGAWPKMPIRCAQIFGETAVSLMSFCCAIQRHICRVVQALARKSRNKTGNGQTPESAHNESQEYRNSRPISRGIVVATTVLKFSKDWIMPTGKVKFYREDSGYGLIEPDEGGKDVFVHVTSVADPSVEIFREDRRVRYVERVSQRSGNPEAFDVVVL